MHHSLSMPKRKSSSSSSASTSSNASVSGRHPIYKGVRRRYNGKWVSEIREPKKPNRIWLGTYSTPEMAAVAYDVASLALKGQQTDLNFPNSASSLPLPASNSARDIQAAAAAAAAAAGAAADALSGVNKVDETNSSTVNEFMDDELIFDMPNLLVNMAEGMLVSPPRLDLPGDDVGMGTADDHNLWNHT